MGRGNKSNFLFFKGTKLEHSLKKKTPIFYNLYVLRNFEGTL